MATGTFTLILNARKLKKPSQKRTEKSSYLQIYHAQTCSTVSLARGQILEKHCFPCILWAALGSHGFVVEYSVSEDWRRL